MLKVLSLLFFFGLSIVQAQDTCPPDNSGPIVRLPHETDCKLFYTCNFGQRILLSCPPDMVFDSQRRVCVIGTQCLATPAPTQPQEIPTLPPVTTTPPVTPAPTEAPVTLAPTEAPVTPESTEETTISVPGAETAPEIRPTPTGKIIFACSVA